MIGMPMRMVFAVVLMTIVVGCSQAPAGGPTATLPTVSAPVATPAPATTSSITETSPRATATGLPRSDPPRPEPPTASLFVEGGDPVAGQLGGYSWENTGSAAPWLPGSPIHVGGGERLMVSLSIPVDIAHWSIERTPFDTFGTGEVGVAEGDGEPVEFAAPPTGKWSVVVQMWFADGRGDAAYYWAIEVD